MTTLREGNSLLAALSEGLPPDAEPLLCDDLRGPHSIFGEGNPLPKPIYEPDSLCRLEGERPDPSEKGAPLPPHSAVLWESAGPATPLERAEAMPLDGRGGAGEYASELSVAAPTFIAGQSSSSFALAWRLHAAGVFPAWASVLCSCQTAGRGQLRRHWHSPRGNLHVTFRLPEHPVFQGEAASVAAGYLVTAAFRQLGFPVALKWPNDVLLGDRKVGGILLEEKDGVIMAGLGVNIAEMPAESDLRRDRAVGAAILLPHHARGGAGEGGECDDLPLAPFSLWRRLVAGAILEYSQRVVRGGLAFVRQALNGSVPETHDAFSRLSRGQADPESRFPPEGAGGHPFGALLAWQGRRVALVDGEEAVGILLGVGPRGGALLGLDDGARRECFSGSLHLA